MADQPARGLSRRDLATSSAACGSTPTPTPATTASPARGQPAPEATISVAGGDGADAQWEPAAMGLPALAPVCSAAGVHQGDSAVPSLASEPASSIVGAHMGQGAPAAKTGRSHARERCGGAAVAAGGAIPATGAAMAGVPGSSGEVAARCSTLCAPAPQSAQGRGGKGMEDAEGEGEGRWERALAAAAGAAWVAGETGGVFS